MYTGRWKSDKYVAMVTLILMLWLRGIGSLGVCAVDWWRKDVMIVVHKTVTNDH